MPLSPVSWSRRVMSPTASSPRSRGPGAPPAHRRRSATTTDHLDRRGRGRRGTSCRLGDRCARCRRRRGGRAGSGGSTSSPTGDSAVTTATVTDPTSTPRAACRSRLKYGEIHPRTLLADVAAHPAGRDERRRDVRHRAGLARVLRRRALAPARTRRGTTCARAGRAALRRPAERPPRRGVARGADRLSRSSTPACGSCSARAGCTTGCGWSRPASSPRTSTSGGRSAPGTSSTTSSTATSPRTTTAGSGWPAPARTPRRTSGSSTRSRRGRRFDPDRRLRAPVGARARPPGRGGGRTSRGSTGTGMSTGTRGGSSTMMTSAGRPWPATSWSRR